MKVYQFTEQPYYPAWTEHSGSLRVNLLNRKCDPHIAADLFHRYYDEWQLADELGAERLPVALHNVVEIIVLLPVLRDCMVNRSE